MTSDVQRSRPLLASPKTALEKEIKEVTSVTSPVTSLESRAGVQELLVNSVSWEHGDADQQAGSWSSGLMRSGWAGLGWAGVGMKKDGVCTSMWLWTGCSRG